jgi:hypothetical protein
MIASAVDILVQFWKLSCCYGGADSVWDVLSLGKRE